jgi:hypothetical protein
MIGMTGPEVAFFLGRAQQREGSQVAQIMAALDRRGVPRSAGTGSPDYTPLERVIRALDAVPSSRVVRDWRRGDAHAPVPVRDMLAVETADESGAQNALTQRQKGGR